MPSKKLKASFIKIHSLNSPRLKRGQVFGRTAVAQYLKKGKMVYAEGSPDVDGYLNKENQPAATLRMRVQNLQLLGGGDGAPQSNGGGQAIASSAPTSSATRMSDISEPADDLPF